MQQPNIFRRGIHHFVQGLCAVAIGITPPKENQEVPFLLAILGFFVVVAGVMYAVAKLVG